MNKKNLLKFLLDIGMVLVLVLMYNKRSVNMTFHELGGLILIGVMLIHVLLNYKWVITVTRKLFSKNIPVKTKIGYILNFLLLISFLLIGISGIMISKTLFHLNIRGGGWQTVHYTVSAVALILIGIHLGLHKEFLCCMTRKLLPLPKKVGKIIGITLTSVIVIFGCYSLVTTSFTRWLFLPFSSGQVKGGFDKNSRPDFPGGLSGDNTFPQDDNIPQDGNFPQDGLTPGDGTLPQDDAIPDDGTPAKDTTISMDEQSLQDDQNNLVTGNGSTTRGRNFRGQGQPPFGNGNGQQDGFGLSGYPKGKDGNEGVLAILITIAQFFSITYLFAVLTAILEKLLRRKKKAANSLTEEVMPNVFEELSPVEDVAVDCENLSDQ